METAFLNTDGALCEKLMASLQAAKRPGADARCLNAGISSASAYIRVAQPTDTDSGYGNLWLDINTWLDSGEFNGDPIDEVQRKFDAFKTTLVSIDENIISKTKIYPNPTTGHFILDVGDTKISKVELYNIVGQLQYEKVIKEENSLYNLDISNLENGLYV